MKRTILIFLLSLPALYASEHRGVIRYNSLPVPGATAIATQGEKKVIAVTDLQGFYLFPDLADGSWTFRIEMLGFQSSTREITIGSETPGVSWELTMLSLDKIKTEPLPAVFQQTEVAAPVANADASPASEPAKSNAFANLSSEQLSERAADGLLINGSVNNGADSPFAQRMAFGNNRIFRSLYNGSLNLVLENSAFNARSFSLTGQDTPKPDYNRMQFALTVGGPVRIPFLMKKPLNAFLTYQRNQNRNASVLTSRMPTLEERNGDLSQVRDSLGQAVQIHDPDTGLPFAGNIIPNYRISPQASSLLSLYPAPNSENGGRYNYQTPVVSASHQDSIQGSLNHYQMGSQISGNFSYQSMRSDNPNIFNFQDKSKTSSLGIGTNYSRSFGQRSSMRLGYQFTRSTSRTTPHFADRVNISGAAGISGNNQDPTNWGPPNLSLSNYAQLTDGKASFDRELTHFASAAFRLSRGEHNLSFGFEIRRQQLNLLSQQDPRGTYAFTGAAAGYDFADFLLGIPDSSSIAFGNADKYFRGSTYAAYINDDYRVSSTFTLNGGIRWEYETPITELYGRLVNLDITPDFQAIAPVLANDPNGLLTGRRYSSSLVHPDKRGVQPRIGFAWRPAVDSSWIIRGGYGLYRDTSVYRSIAVQMAQQSPFSKSLVVGNSAATPLTLANGFNLQPNIAVNNFAIDPNFRVANAHNWQLSIQRDLPGSMQIVAMYQGSQGSHLVQKSYPNTYPEKAAGPSGFLYQSSNGESIRHAGIVQLRRRLRRGFAAEAKYTFSKSMDDAALGGSQAAQNWLDLKAERALSNFDQRHVLNIQTQYTSGSGGFRPLLLKGWAGALLKEWTFTGNMSIGSGMPLSPIYSAVVQGTGMTGSIRPNRTSESIYAAPAGLSLNPAAFSAPETGQWGNAGRNSITGPSQFSFDASLGRAFRVRDRYNIEFRLNSRNILNHVTFPGWNTTVNSSQFGLPSSANPMRTVQTNVRISF
jgi:trimeric autotransporter adhesin